MPRLTIEVALTAFLAVLCCGACADEKSKNDTGRDSGKDDTESIEGETDLDTAAMPDLGPSCPPLSGPEGNVVTVSPNQASSLQQTVQSAVSGDTILLEDGVYELGGAYLWFATPEVTLRSASGDREAVILDGNLEGSEIITVAASDVTIADITIRRAYTHPIHVVSTDDGDTLNTLIYNVHIVDPREQAIKINPHEAKTNYPDQGVIACSHIELTDAGRPHVNPTSGGCYTGGVDAHYARDWVIRDNRIEGFFCADGLSEHAVHLWRGCRDTLVERNALINNARGVGFGLAESGEARTYQDDDCPVSGYVGHYGGVIRNNFIYASARELFASSDGFDCGICLWSACGARVVHNTIVSTGDNFSSIEWRFTASQDIEIANNLVTHPLRERDGASATETGNLTDAPLTLFVDAAAGDLHLAEDAIDAIDHGAPLSSGLCDEDIDGDPRDDTPDIGADELVSDR
jgi:hypothetical protein